MFVSAMTGGIDWAMISIERWQRPAGNAVGPWVSGRNGYNWTTTAGRGSSSFVNWAGDIPLFANFGAVNLLG